MLVHLYCTVGRSNTDHVIKVLNRGVNEERNHVIETLKHRVTSKLGAVSINTFFNVGMNSCYNE